MKARQTIYIVGKLNKCRFREKNELPVFFCNSTKENCKDDRENDHASFNQTNELIGYQNSADFCEIWPKHSLDVVKQKCVGDF